MKSLSMSRYVHKTVSFAYDGVQIDLGLSQGAFSSYDVDEGTKLLLKTIAGEVDFHYVRSVLDVGCGVGVLGLALRARHPHLEVALTDRSVFAVALARANAERNDLSVARLEPALGVTGAKVDLIVSNVPAKAGRPVIEDLLRRCGHHLTSAGRAAVVVVSPLAGLVSTTLDGIGAEILHREETKNHVVFHFRGAGRPADDEFAPYIRQSGSADYAGFRYDVDTVYGLPEFDTLSFGSELLLDAAAGKVGGGRLFVLNPGQGHVPCALSSLRRIRSFVLASDDLLQLEVSGRNLRKNGAVVETIAPVPHPGAVVPPERDGRFDAALLSYDPVSSADWLPDIIACVDELAGVSRFVLLLSSSTACHRIERGLGASAAAVTINASKKYRGRRVLRLRRSK